MARVTYTIVMEVPDKDIELFKEEFIIQEGDYLSVSSEFFWALHNGRDLGDYVGETLTIGDDKIVDTHAATAAAKERAGK